MSMNLEVKKFSKANPDDSIEKLKLLHTDCFGGKITVKKWKGNPIWNLECTRCGNRKTIYSEEAIAIFKVAIFGGEAIYETTGDEQYKIVC